MQSASLISSSQNPKVRRLLRLQLKSSARVEEGVFVVEGERELRHCLHGGYDVVCVYLCRDIARRELVEYLDTLKGVALCEVSRNVYDRLAYRQDAEGVIAEVRTRALTLDGLALGERPLIVVLERVEKPGNLGAVLRSADAAGADAVIVCDPLTDLYNPNLIRGSLGAVFSVPCVACASEECIAFLKSRGVQILTAQLQDSSLYYDTDMRRGTAIVMGAESTGLTGQWRAAADAHIRIPMLGQMDSLNVSVSAAILLFEAVRQREKLQ